MGVHSARIATLLALPFLIVPGFLSSGAEAKTHYYAELHAAGDQSEEWQNGVQAVNDAKPGSIVRIICADDALPDKQSTLRIFALNRSNQPINVGPENVSIELPGGERVPMISYEELAGRLRRDIKRRKTAALIGNVLSSMGADGSTSGSVDVTGMTSNGTLFTATGSYTGYDPLLQQQQEEAVERQAARVAAAIQDRQNVGLSALSGLMRRTTVQPGGSFGGIVAYEASPSFKQVTDSTPVTLIIQVGSDEHRIAATLSQLRDKSRQMQPTGTRSIAMSRPSALQTASAREVNTSAFPQTAIVPASVKAPISPVRKVAANDTTVDPYEAGRAAGRAAAALASGN